MTVMTTMDRVFHAEPGVDLAAPRAITDIRRTYTGQVGTGTGHTGTIHTRTIHTSTGHAAMRTREAARAPPQRRDAAVLWVATSVSHRALLYLPCGRFVTAVPARIATALAYLRTVTVAILLTLRMMTTTIGFFGSRLRSRS